MTPKETQQITEERDAQNETVKLLELARDKITELNEETENQIKESGAEK